jgi:predicted DNA-binding protein
MQRTNIYLPEEQIQALRAVAEQRGDTVASLVREAIDSWLEANGVRVLGEDEWERRFDALLERRRVAARELKLTEEDVERDVMAAVKEVRKARAARRR